MRHDFVSTCVGGAAIVSVACVVSFAQTPKQKDHPQESGTPFVIEFIPMATGVQKGDATAKVVEARTAAAKRILDVQRAANTKNLIQLLMPQFRTAVRADLLLVHEICHLNREDFRTLQRESEIALKEVVAHLVEESQLGWPADGVVRRTGRSSGSINLDGARALQTALIAVMRKHLTHDQLLAYQAELDKRAADAKESALRFLVEAIDLELYLSDEQRKKITEALAKHWTDGLTSDAECLLYGRQLYPMGIDSYVTPVLNPAQKKVWRGLLKGPVSGNNGLVWGHLIIDDGVDIEVGDEDGSRPGAPVRLGADAPSAVKSKRDIDHPSAVSRE